MTLVEIINKFIKNPANIKMGAGKLSQRWGCSKDDIYEAKRVAKKQISSLVQIPQKPQILQTLKTSPNTETIYIGSQSSGDITLKRFESLKALSADQLSELVQADGINTEISKVKDRLSGDGTWTYDVEVRYKRGGFYTREELKVRLKEIFPDTTPITLPIVNRVSEKALVILLSDDHVGAINGDSLFGNKWDASIYAKRLLKVSDEVKRLGTKFEEVHILSLGDQLNGFNSQTTRGGHEIASLSNKEQFDIYTSARKLFYDDLLMSGTSKKYFLHDVENSNHSGSSYSYMANRLLETYIECKYPDVKRKSYFLPIEHFHYGIHTIGFGHGKDEKLMLRPMPLKLDPRTDLFLYQYFDKQGVSPADRRVTMYKGDLHSYAVDKGKFGRYINIPSIMGSTDYTEINFGNTEPGAVFEIFDKHSKNVQHCPIWF